MAENRIVKQGTVLLSQGTASVKGVMKDPNKATPAFAVVATLICLIGTLVVFPNMAVFAGILVGFCIASTYQLITLARERSRREAAEELQVEAYSEPERYYHKSSLDLD